MTKRVTIVDYGVGNLMSVSRALAKVGGEPVLTGDPAAIAGADRLLLPGVGAYGDCGMALRARQGLEEAVCAFVETGKPLLGICVGMQILFDVGEEFGEHDGLSLVPGRVKAIPAKTVDGEVHKIPHIGWTALEVPKEANADRWSGSILSGVAPGEAMYFVHSFTAWPDNPSHRLADAYYGGQRIAAAIQKDNITATQFHPEKSGEAGLNLLTRFLSE